MLEQPLLVSNQDDLERLYQRIAEIDYLEWVRQQRPICMHASYKLEAQFNLVSSYNDLKVKVKYKIKIHPVSLFICQNFDFIIIVRYIAAK